tara:strand:+ start:295 stop:510 length:216 start_codon:yes stop_codon:yes gene_type:complete
MKDITQEIKNEIFEYVNTQELSVEELKLVDNYVKELLEYLDPIIRIQEKVMHNEKDFKAFKKSVLKEIFGD